MCWSPTRLGDEPLLGLVPLARDGSEALLVVAISFDHGINQKH
jgi:hypothetical protein